MKFSHLLSLVLSRKEALRGKRPTPKQLRLMNIPIVFQYPDADMGADMDANMDVIVYQNSYVFFYYHPAGLKSRRTVFSLHEIEIEYEFATHKVKFSESMLNDLDAVSVITTYGMERIINNSDAVEKKYVPVWMDDPVKDGETDNNGKQVTVADFMEQMRSPSAEKVYFDHYNKECIVNDFVEMYKQLSKIQQDVIYLYYFKEMTETEIAELLGYSRSNIQHHRNKAIEKMNKMAKAQKMPKKK